jgi:hypothetical protein
MAGARSMGMTVIAAMSLVVGLLGLVGSASMVSDGLGITHIGTATSGPTVGSTSAPPPGDTSTRVRVTLFGVVRVMLSLVLVVGAVGTIGVRPSGRRASLVYAVGWIVVGGLEPWLLGYRFGWQVVASAAYPFLLLMLFNDPGWKAAFAPRNTADAGPARERLS